MGKRKFYLTLDTETATLPFADKIANNAIEKQRIAIAKPLVYNIGWVIATTQGEVVKKREYLVQETFFVPQVFNTAYYKDKRPIYMAKLKNGEIDVDTWDNIIDDLIADLKRVDMTTAFNATFDFKKAIPFTEEYIRMLYSDSYTEWENRQYWICKKIADGNNTAKNADFLKPCFKIRDNEFDIVDLWGLACDRLINIPKYKKFCLDNSYVTNSVMYFKTSAEIVYKYLNNDLNFEEEHTALSDSEIETAILAKCLKKGKINPNIESFPFQKLGTTLDYVVNKKSTKYAEILLDLLDKYFESKQDQINNNSSYWKRMENMRNVLERI